MTNVNVSPKLIRFPIFLDYIAYFGMHVTCFAVFWTGVKLSDLVLCFCLYFLRVFGLTAGYHRYFSHRSFKTSRAFQFLLGLLGTLGYERGPLWWASHHRYHHRYSDTHLDFHSPIHRGFVYSHCLWFLDQRNRETQFDRVGDLARYPELVWLDKWYLLPVFSFAFLLFAFFGWRGVVWGFCVNTILIWHASHAIGSFGHRFGGYRRFVTTDNSRNKWFIALALMGDGWHNNHHFYPSSARQGFVWWEIDTAYYVLKLMKWTRLIWDVRIPPKHLIHSGKVVAQSHLRKFELWLTCLRLSMARCVEEVARNQGLHTDSGSIQLLKQSIEILLDDFSDNVIDSLHRNPEDLSNVIAALRFELFLEVKSLSHKLSEESVSKLSMAIESELHYSAPNCPFGHLLLERNEASLIMDADPARKTLTPHLIHV